METSPGSVQVCICMTSASECHSADKGLNQGSPGGLLVYEPVIRAPDNGFRSTSVN